MSARLTNLSVGFVAGLLVVMAGKDLSPKGPITEFHGSAVAPSAGEAVALPIEEEY